MPQLRECCWLGGIIWNHGRPCWGDGSDDNVDGGSRGVVFEASTDDNGAGGICGPTLESGTNGSNSASAESLILINTIRTRGNQKEGLLGTMKDLNACIAVVEEGCVRCTATYLREDMHAFIIEKGCFMELWVIHPIMWNVENIDAKYISVYIYLRMQEFKFGKGCFMELLGFPYMCVCVCRWGCLHLSLRRFISRSRKISPFDHVASTECCHIYLDVDGFI